MGKELVYISGPITGKTKAEEIRNINRMTNAALEVASDKERVVFHPAHNHEEIGAFLNWGWKDYMRADLEILKRVDTIFMMDTWQQSRGARMEHFLAKRWGINIEYQDPAPQSPVRKPGVSEYWYYEDEI